MVVVVVAACYCTHHRMKKLALKRKEKKKTIKKITNRSTIMVDIYGWLWLWHAIIVILE